MTPFQCISGAPWRHKSTFGFHFGELVLFIWPISTCILNLQLRYSNFRFEKKLSYHRETTQRAVSLEILNFTWTGTSPVKMLIPLDRQLIVLKLCRWKFSNSETLWQNFIACSKNGKFGFWNPRWGVRGDVWRWLESPWSTSYSL